MSDDLQDLKISLEMIQNNNIELYLTDDWSGHNIPEKVFQLHRETTNCAKQVFKHLKEHSNFGSDLHGLRTHRQLLVEFMSALSALSSLQRKIIERSLTAHDCPDCGSVSRRPLQNRLFGSDSKFFWLSIGAVVIGGLSLFRSVKQ